MIRPGTGDDFPLLIAIWRAAIEATHNFLVHADIDDLELKVRDIYLSAVEIWVACGGDGTPLGFIGLSANKVEMLFIDPRWHGKGIGKALLAYARRLKGPLTVDVNEQNPQAHRFYLKCGFRDVGRSELDGQGLPFPLLHMAQEAS